MPGSVDEEELLSVRLFRLLPACLLPSDLNLRYFEGQVNRSLFHRLTHIIQKQEWDAIGDSYWLKHAVELILCIANSNTKIGEGCKSSNKELFPPEGKSTAILDQNDLFLNELYESTMGNLLHPLCELLHHSNALAHSMWIELFPYSWSSLTSDEQQALTKPLGMLIARDCNKFQDLRRPNVVQVRTLGPLVPRLTLFSGSSRGCSSLSPSSCHLSSCAEVCRSNVQCLAFCLEHPRRSDHEPAVFVGRSKG